MDSQNGTHSSSKLYRTITNESIGLVQSGMEHRDPCAKGCYTIQQVCSLSQASDRLEPVLWFAGITTGLSAIGSGSRSHWGWFLVALYTCVCCFAAAFHIRKLSWDIEELEARLEKATRNSRSGRNLKSAAAAGEAIDAASLDIVTETQPPKARSGSDDQVTEI